MLKRDGAIRDEKGWVCGFWLSLVLSNEAANGGDPRVSMLFFSGASTRRATAVCAQPRTTMGGTSAGAMAVRHALPLAPVPPATTKFDSIRNNGPLLQQVGDGWPAGSSGTAWRGNTARADCCWTAAAPPKNGTNKNGNNGILTSQVGFRRYESQRLPPRRSNVQAMKCLNAGRGRYYSEQKVAVTSRAAPVQRAMHGAHGGVYFIKMQAASLVSSGRPHARPGARQPALYVCLLLHAHTRRSTIAL